MNKVDYLRGLVNQAATVYKQNPKVKAIALVGSSALGMVDNLSDTDCTIYYSELPTEDEVIAAREQIMDRFGDYYFHDPEQGYAEYYFVNGVKMDFGHITISDWEQDIDEVLAGDITEPIRQKPLSGISDALPLYGETLVNQWIAKARHYPDNLAEKMVKEHFRFRPLWVLQDMAAGRGDVQWYYEEVVLLSKNLLGVLLGLNRLWHPMEYKHQDWFLAKMSIAPPNLSPRLTQVFRMEPSEGVLELIKLVDETIALTAQHMPDVVDTDAMYRRFHMPPCRWELPA